MKITITSKKNPIDDKLGRLAHNETYELPDHKALFYIQRGEAVEYMTKVMQDRPCLGAGVVEPLSALPVAQALPQTTVSESDSGAKKKGRKPKQSS